MTESRPQLGILLLFFLFQPLLESFAPAGYRVDFAFLLLFWIAMRAGRVPTLLWAFALGLIRDVSDFETLGASSAAFVPSAWLLSDLRHRVDRKSVLMRMVLFLLSFLLARLIFYLVYDWPEILHALLLWLREGLLHAFLGLVFYFLLLGLIFLFREGLGVFREANED
ncbi:MAG: rod shape-determining protein MreD [Candidatus Krumholzibacteria bacterium]|jgi:rod shape-determining protein MreD|nr:rod shape-determining protein MreD [Candidatus Krumholzibacteria bacterium]MDP6669778.1 rod shape-determining protein MreD [Candidatus Krumholzibacteria bacterium]MDP6797701.1 rod shape-determining protein MreD [Candidatus Krumholzibacteria bacterium]MDP7021161.1 rod shape-determining protein MreD [Candidatus Krumholzibacteria bacterium]